MIELRSLKIGSLLGGGGFGEVFDLPNHGLGAPMVLKRYRASTVQDSGAALSAALESIVEYRQALSDEKRKVLDQLAVWPLETVWESSNCVGYVMRRIPDEFFETIRLPGSGRQKIVPRDGQSIMTDPTLATPGYPVLDPYQRLELCRKIAYFLHFLHYTGVVFGDISAKNFMYSVRAQKMGLVVVDTDAVRLKGAQSPFGSQPHTPDWEPVEYLNAQRRLASKSVTEEEKNRLSSVLRIQSTKTDVYKFGLLVLRLLQTSGDSFDLRNSAHAEDVLRQLGCKDAARCLSRSLQTDPGDRPTMESWCKALGLSVGASSRAAIVTPNVGAWTWSESTNSWMRP